MPDIFQLYVNCVDLAGMTQTDVAGWLATLGYQSKFIIDKPKKEFDWCKLGGDLDVVNRFLNGHHHDVFVRLWDQKKPQPKKP